MAAYGTASSSRWGVGRLGGGLAGQAAPRPHSSPACGVSAACQGQGQVHSIPQPSSPQTLHHHPHHPHPDSAGPVVGGGQHAERGHCPRRRPRLQAGRADSRGRNQGGRQEVGRNSGPAAGGERCLCSMAPQRRLPSVTTSTVFARLAVTSHPQPLHPSALLCPCVPLRPHTGPCCAGWWRRCTGRPTAAVLAAVLAALAGRSRCTRCCRCSWRDRCAQPPTCRCACECVAGGMSAGTPDKRLY